MTWFASSSGDRRSAEPALLDEALLSALRSLSLPVRRARGVLPGAHAGGQPGRGEEFFQHRAYVRGEDVRAVDWRASARSGHLLVKDLHRPLRQPLALLLDESASMQLPSVGSKALCARRLGAALAFLALRRGDPVTLFSLDAGAFSARARAVPGGRAAASAEALLAAARPCGRADLASALSSLAEAPLAGAHAVLLSDLYGDEARIAEGFSALARAGAALTVVQVLSAADREVPAGSVRDAESDEGRLLGGADAAGLAVRVEQWASRLRGAALRASAEPVAADAALHPVRTLRRWLTERP